MTACDEEDLTYLALAGQIVGYIRENNLPLPRAKALFTMVGAMLEANNPLN